MEATTPLSSMKSVCILVQNYYEIDVRVRRKAETLAAAGFNVDVLALASGFSKARSYVLNGVNVYTLSLGKQRGSLARYAYEYLAFFAWCFFKLLRWTGKKRYAVIDVNNLPDFLVFAGAYAKLRGAKIVFDMHEITPEFYISKYKIREGSAVIRLLKLIEKASFKFADHVITINDPIKKLLEERGLQPSKVTIIMNSADESLFAAAVNTPAPAGAGATRQKFVMMYHGTLTRIYGLDIAIEAFGKVQQDMPDAEFWIIGGGTERASLENLSKKLGLESKVKFIGNVTPQEIPQWLSRCDAGVLATRRDVFLDYSFSNKLSEYIIMGKPVISSRLRTIRHYFSDDALAFFDPNDPADLARAMLHVYRIPDRSRQQCARARQEYAPLCWTVMRQRYLKLMDVLTGQNTVQRDFQCAPVAEAGTDVRKSGANRPVEVNCE
jgi:glycosyltransferase involved in cell wall biosynthesis